MSDNYYNLSPEDKKKQDEDMYQKFIILAIVPLFIYLLWPFVFGTNKLEEQAKVVEDRIENIDEDIEETLDIAETTPEQKETKITPVPVKPKRTPPNKVNKVQPGAVKKRPVPNNRETFEMTYNKGDEIEYTIQNAGWKGVVQGENNGNYIVKITEVVTANAQQRYLPGNNPCFGNKPIGKNAVNQIIIVPGRCMHAK